MTGGDIVAKMIKEAGIDVVFTLSGFQILPVYDGLKSFGVKMVDARHEQGAAHMAEGYAISKRYFGVLLVTAGPGFTNTLTGIANSYHSGIPILVISGSSPLSDRGKGAFMEMDQLSLAKPVTKWAKVVGRVDETESSLKMAFSQLLSGKPGPCYVEIPQDILYKKVEGLLENISSPNLEKRVVFPSQKEIDAALSLMRLSKKPVLVLGDGLFWSGGEKEFLSLCERSCLPVVTRKLARGVFPDSSRNCIGHTLRICKDADLFILAGCKINYTLAYGAYFKGKKVIKIDIDPIELERNIEADVKILCDVSGFAQAISDSFDKEMWKDWLDELRRRRRIWDDAIANLINSEKNPINPLKLCKEVKEVFGKDAIYVADGGDTAVFAREVFESNFSAQLISYGLSFGCIGTGIPYAIASKVVNPKKEVVVINGDGSFGLNAMELDTSIRHGIPIKVVINNDKAWGMIKHLQKKRFKEVGFGTSLGERRYEKICEALGGSGYFVDDVLNLKNVLFKLKEEKNTSVLNVLVDPDISSAILKESRKSIV